VTRAGRLTTLELDVVGVLMQQLYLVVTSWPPHPMCDPHLHEELKRLVRSGWLAEVEAL
jgi:hypothetical protein